MDDFRLDTEVVDQEAVPISFAPSVARTYPGGTALLHWAISTPLAAGQVGEGVGAGDRGNAVGTQTEDTHDSAVYDHSVAHGSVAHGTEGGDGVNQPQPPNLSTGQMPVYAPPPGPGRQRKPILAVALAALALICAVAALVVVICSAGRTKTIEAAPTSIAFSPPTIESSTGMVSPYVNETPVQAKAALCTGSLFDTIAAVTAAGRSESQQDPQRYLTLYSTLQVSALLHPNAPASLLDGYRKYALAIIRGSAGGDDQQAASDQIDAACK